MFALAGFMLEFVVLVVVEVLVAPVAPFTCVFVTVLTVVLALVLVTTAFLLVVLAAVFVLAVSPPQAIPNAPSAKRVESAIIFFMSKWTLLSFSKNILTYFYLLPPRERYCPRTVKFWNNRQYSHPAYISQLLTRRKTGLNKNLF